MWRRSVVVSKFVVVVTALVTREGFRDLFLKMACLIAPDERVAAAACGSLANIAACKSEPEDQPTVKQVLHRYHDIHCL